MKKIAAGGFIGSNHQSIMPAVFARYFFNRFALIVFVCVWFLWVVIVTFTTLTTPKSYLSTARVRLESSETDLNREQMDDAVQTILSQAVVNGVVVRLDLAKTWSRRYFSGIELSTSQAMRILTNRISIFPVHNSNLIEILSYNDRPDEAAQIANCLAETFQTFTAEKQNRLLAGKSDAAKSSSPSVQIEDHAQAALKPCKPKIPLNIILGMVAAILYGAIAACLAVAIRNLFRKHIVFKPVNPNDHISHCKSVKQIY
jgi:capsular polysaccharide biosynthesis protein